MTLLAFKMSRHLAEISPKLPIGVGAKYNKAYCRLYFFLNLSTRPALSTIFSLPVKNGWQAEQISTRISALFERVLKVLPQAQVTVHSTYSGCMFCFIACPFCEIFKSLDYIKLVFKIAENILEFQNKIGIPKNGIPKFKAYFGIPKFYQSID